MATRFYLPISGTSPLNSQAVDSTWEGSASTFFRAPLVTSKSNTALTDKAARFGSTATRQDCWAQWASVPLATAHNFTTADTISMVVRGLEGNGLCDAHLAYVVRVVNGDGSTVRGTIATFMATSTELTTSALTRIHNARAFNNAVKAQAGDRIVVELGSHGVTPDTGYDVTWRFGDPSATSDFALTAGLTTDLCPWVEISPTVSMGTPSATEIYECGNANASGTSTAPAVTHGVTIDSNDVVVAIIHANTEIDVTDNNGSYPFTQSHHIHLSDGAGGWSASLSVWYRVAGASEPASYNFTIGSSQRWAIVVRVFDNVDTASPWDVAPAAGSSAIETTSGGSTPGTAPTMTVGATGAAGITAFAADLAPTTNTWSSPTNSYGYEVENSGVQSLATYIRLGMSSGASGATSATPSAAEYWGAFQVALKKYVASGSTYFWFHTPSVGTGVGTGIV